MKKTKMSIRAGDLVSVSEDRDVPARVIATSLVGVSHGDPMGEEHAVEIETATRGRRWVPESVVSLATDVVSAVAALDAAKPTHLKIQSRVTNGGRGIHIHSAIFVGEPEFTLARAGEFTMRREEWLVFVAGLRLGARFSDGKLSVDVPHEPARTDDGEPAHGCEMCDGEDACTCPGKGWHPVCLTCGGRWPECGQ